MVMVHIGRRGVCREASANVALCIEDVRLAGAFGTSPSAHSTNSVGRRSKDTSHLSSPAFATTVCTLPHLVLLRRVLSLHDELVLATIELGAQSGDIMRGRC
jgi:hypothetical protein